MPSHETITKRIISSGTYMTLATSTEDNPWACALFMGLDEEYHLYFVSNVRSLHVQNVLKNRCVSVVIFDSHAVAGNANGVQLTGFCQRLVGKDVRRGIDAIYSRRYQDPAERTSRNLSVEEFSLADSDSTASHIYEITPEHVYVLDKSRGEDIRIEIDLKGLRGGL